MLELTLASKFSQHPLVPTCYRVLLAAIPCPLPSSTPTQGLGWALSSPSFSDTCTTQPRWLGQPFCPFALLASWFPGYLAPGSSLNLPSSHLAGLSRPVMSSLDSSRCPFSPSYLQQTSSSSTPRSRHVFLLLLFSFSGLVFLIFLLFSKVINLLCREIR